MMAGNNRTEKINAASTPTATTLPSSLNGGTSLLFMLRKPMAVVRLVTNTGFKLIRRDSRIAVFLSRPRRISANMVERICTLSAIASVMIITGATAVGEVIIMPRCPINPMATTVDIPITTRVTNEAEKERSRSPTPTIIIRYIKGTRVALSSWPTWLKTWSKGTVPVR